MAEAAFENIKKFLEERNVAFRVLIHEPVYTSEHAAMVRDVDIKTGVKAIVMVNKDGQFVVALIAANKKIDGKKLGTIAGLGRFSFAQPEDVMRITGCEPGSVPPFGNLFGLKVYADKSLLENEEVNFNAGLHTHSIAMKCKDLIKLVNPEIGEFSAE